MKKAEKTERTKERILKAAVEEFGAHGYHGATVNQICQAYHIAKGLIYYNYKNKDTLYLNCARFAVDEFIAFMEQQNIGTDLQKYMLLRYRFFEEHPQLGHLIFELLLQPPDNVKEELEKIKLKFDEFNFNLYTKAICLLKLRKGVTKEDAVQYYNILQNMLNGYLIRQDLGGGAFQELIRRHEDELEKILNFMLYGIAEPEGEDR